MLGAIVRGALRHPRLVVVAGILLLAYGLMTVRTARYDVFPEFVPPQAALQTEAPGLAAEQVEALVTRPLEAVINGTNGVTSVRSESVQGLSVIDVVFADGSDPFRDPASCSSRSDCRSRRPPARNGHRRQRLSPLTSSTMDLLKVGFTSDRRGSTRWRCAIMVQWTGAARACWRCPAWRAPSSSAVRNAGWRWQVHPADDAGARRRAR